MSLSCYVAIRNFVAVQIYHSTKSTVDLFCRNGAEWADIRKKMQKIFLSPSAASQFYGQQLEVCQDFVKALNRENTEQKKVVDFKLWACRFAAECKSL